MQLGYNSSNPKGNFLDVILNCWRSKFKTEVQSNHQSRQLLKVGQFTEPPAFAKKNVRIQIELSILYHQTNCERYVDALFFVIPKRYNNHSSQANKCK